MSLHKSLTSGGQLKKHRSVLTRRERLEKLAEKKKWTEEDSVYGLPKVGNRKSIGKKKKKKDDAEAEE